MRFRRWLTASLVAWCAPAWAQEGSGTDLLDIARRASVVDEVLAEHAERIRTSQPFGVDPGIRVATNLSYYLVGDLEVIEPDQTYEVELNRAYTGFLVDIESVFYLAGGGLSYGLQRPYFLPDPAADIDKAKRSDLTGQQFTDEQYVAGGQWRGWSGEASWARGQVLDATADGRADLDTVEQRHQRVQGRIDSPLGVRLSTRWALGGGIENLALGWAVNDTVDAVTDTTSGLWVPKLDVGFRKSDYLGDDARAHPRLLGAGVTEDVGWLMAALVPGIASSASGGVRALADADLAGAQLQLALVDARLGLRSDFVEFELSGGGSHYRDERLLTSIGAPTINGFHVGGDLAMGMNRPTCPEEKPDCRPMVGKLALSVSYRDSWAEELRYVVDYAGKPQTWFYLELLGGG